jgi:hypothetical protein
MGYTGWKYVSQDLSLICDYSYNITDNTMPLPSSVRVGAEINPAEA